MYSIISFIFIVGLIVIIGCISLVIGFVLAFFNSLKRPRNKRNINRYIRRKRY